jgi:TRAP-type C4-dicarboxylate transport system substrate-binding protein
VRTSVCWMAAGLAVIVAAGCGGGKDVDRTGRPADTRPVTLTLANHETDPSDVAKWTEAVERLSHGSLKIDVSNGWRNDEPNYDKGIIGDVRSGKVPLAKVAARAYDEVGVTSFDPLLAPLLIDSTPLAAAVVGGPIGDRALRGTERLRLVGLAMFPTELRRPVGITRGLRGPQDYRGARISTREGRVIDETLRALGAQRAALPAGDSLRGVDGAELPPTGFDSRAWLSKSARGVTGNVVLWPKPITIVMNGTAFERLSPTQQDALRRAADVARAATAEQQASMSGDSRTRLCRLGTNVLTASAADFEALRSAVRPVYDEIARAPGNADALKQIEQMKSGTRPEVLSCADVPTTGAAKPQAASPLRGTYVHSITKQELESSPLLTDPGEINDGNWGDMTLRFAADGTFHLSGHNSEGKGSESGTYRTDGDKLVLNDAENGYTFAFRWSLYRGTLKLRRDETLGVGPTPLVMKPWRAR